jgi:hypothetical protein
MQVNDQDVTIIEQVLRDAINNSTDYQAIMTYQEVLNRLKGKTDSNPGMQIDVGDPGVTGDYSAVGFAGAGRMGATIGDTAPNRVANQQAFPLDGFHYKSDDPSNVVEPRH